MTEPSTFGERPPALATRTGREPRPLLLDLFSCAGGAAVGYHLAGFDVHGVDVADRPNYPFLRHRGDALARVAVSGMTRVRA